MTTQTMSNDKHAKRHLHKQRDAARAAFASGDFYGAGQMYRQMLAENPDTDVLADAQRGLRAVQLDPGALYALAFGTALYLLAWVYALS